MIVERIMKKENRDKARLENAGVYGNDKRWRLAGWTGAWMGSPLI